MGVLFKGEYIDMKDLIIIGAGPAGLSAAIYGKRAGYDVLVVDESGMGGGQVLTTYVVDNYPGLPGISGFELGDRMKKHAEETGAEFIAANVEMIEKVEEKFVVKSDEGDFEAKAVVVATGAKHRKLMIPGEEELLGMGVSYCATCDGAFFRNRTVVVVGGGDVALEDALFLARACSKVYLVHRRDSFRGAQILVDKVKETENIEIIYNAKVVGIQGEDQVESVKLEYTDGKASQVISTNGVFIAVGMQPVTNTISNLVEMSPEGYVVANESGETSLKGLFVAGDLRTKRLRQIITAAADGANVITSVSEYLNAQ